MRIQFYWAILIALVLFTQYGCASTYNACNDPNSYIEFLPEQCHAGFNRSKEGSE